MDSGGSAGRRGWVAEGRALAAVGFFCGERIEFRKVRREEEKKKMNRNVWASTLLAGAVLLAAGTMRAQDAPLPPGFGHGDGPGMAGPGGIF